MTRTVTIEVAPHHEALVRQALALAEEMEQLALAAPDGTVLATCEEAFLPKGRQFQAQVLADAVARRIAAAEKKGRRSAPVRVAANKKPKGPANATS